MRDVSLLAAWLTSVVIANVVLKVSPEIVTSSFKIRRMVLEEEQLLEELKNYINLQYDKLKSFSSFYSDRLRELRFREDLKVDVEHPNSVYKLIRQYSSIYYRALGEHFHGFYNVVQKSPNVFLAGKEDLNGAKSAILRLQNVYTLNAADMVRGDYLGYQGPQLEPLEAFKIGQMAFTGDNNNTAMAEELYNEAEQLDPNSFEVAQLRRELQNKPVTEPRNEHPYFKNFSHLCSLKKGVYPAEQNKGSAPVFCRYRETVLRYYRFKEEILSVSPFASVIYDVITDEEASDMKDYVKNYLYTARVQGSQDPVLDVRSSNVAWIFDKDSATAATVSMRVALITGLDTAQEFSKGLSSSEAFQVLNYGLGGHYDPHLDPLVDSLEEGTLSESDVRLSTFLIYLSDVERGGATVFTKAGISVAPFKNMALFWYNFNPAMEIDKLTQHGGCPVVIGRKWITNKWILRSGNVFRRRCGLRRDSTQLDIEPDMMRGYR